MPEEMLMRQQVAQIVIDDSAEIADEIVNRARELTREILAYCRSQRELWQRIPNLAFEADGRTGYSPQYQSAYTDGYWLLKAGLTPAYGFTVAIDLATGELVDKDNHDQPAKAEWILRLALAGLGELDAAALIRRLEEESKQPVASNVDEPYPGWRKKERRRLGLSPIYRRV